MDRVLKEEVASGKFREDLFYRLNEVLIQVPPLRDRGDDVLLLASFFLKKYVNEFKAQVKGFTPDATLTWSGSAAAMTVAVSGATNVTRPRPNRKAPGSTSVLHDAWGPIRARRRRPAAASNGPTGPTPSPCARG